MNVETTTIEAKLKRAWDRERWFHHLRGCAFIVPWLVGIFVADLLIDWLFDLPGALRVALLLANLGILGWVGWRRWFVHLRRYDATRVSLQVESLHPELNNLLVSFVQFGPKAKDAHGSAQMIEVVRDQAARAAANLNFGGIVNFKKLRTLLIGAGVTLLLFFASSVFAWEYYLILLGRMLNPFTSLAYPTRTRIVEIAVVRIDPQGQPEKLVVSSREAVKVAIKHGDKVEVLARVAGEVPEQGVLHLKFANASWEQLVLEPSATREVGAAGVSFSQRFPKITQDFSYSFRIGDARSQRYEAKVVLPPRIASVKLRTRAPSYTGRAAEEHVRLQIAPITEGTELTWELQLDQRLKAGRIHFTSEPARAFPLVLDPTDPRRATFTLEDINSLLPDAARTGSVSLSYFFEWTEAEHGFTFTDATRYAVDVLPDKAPVITLLKPRTGGAEDKILATVRKNLHVIFDISDDYGLGKAWISYQLNNDPRVRRRPLGAFPPDSKDVRVPASWLIKDSLPELKEGDLLTCTIEASDNRVGKAGPSVSQSTTFRLHIVTDTEYQQFVDKQVALGLERTTVAALEEVLSSKKVKSLIPEK